MTRRTLAFAPALGLVAGCLVAALPTAGSPTANADGTSYHSVAPQRLLDTRNGLGTTVTGPVVPGAATSLTVPGAPADVAAVVFNLTVTEPQADGYATAYPCGEPPPLASNVNFRAGQTVPNLVIAKPGANGQICIITNVVAHLVADLQGWFPAGSYDPLPAPQRVLDTRTPGSRRFTAGIEAVIVTGQPDGAVVTNITVANAGRAGYLTVYPCGTTAPVTSNLNFAPGDVNANLTIARAGANGSVCATANVDTDIIVDLQGTIPADRGYTPIVPVRMVDTRSPIGVPAAGRIQPGATTELSFPEASGIPSLADTAVINVTATDSARAGFLTVFPCGQIAPLASNLNIAVGDTRPNLVLMPLGPNGTVCITSNVAVQVVADLQGWFDTTQPLPAVAPPTRLHVDRAPGTDLGYLAYLPAGYDSSPGRSWPTIVFLHGSGQAGPGTDEELDSIAVNGLPRLFEAGTEPDVASHFIVIAPQLPDSSYNPGRLHAWLAEVLPRYAVDRDRVYLTGLSAGGFGTFDYVGAYGDANEFAAVVPISGGFPHPIICSSWRRTPLWAFHGETDTTVKPAGSINTVTFINSACSPVERLRLTTYPGVGHSAWDPTYDLSGMAPGHTNPARDPYDIDIYSWMLSHVRSRYR